MKCAACGSDMWIADRKSRSDVGSAAVYIDWKMVCVNPKCDNHSNMENPEKFVVVSNPDNEAAFEEVKANGSGTA